MWATSLDLRAETGIYTGVLMKKLRGAVVGYGFIMDKGHAAGYRQRGRRRDLVAIADVSADRRAAAARRLARTPASTPTTRALLAAEAGNGSTSSTSRRRPATTPRSRTRRSTPACTCCARSRWRRPSTRRGRCCATRRRAERVIYPCHNYKHAPGHQGGARRDRIGPHRQGPPGDAADVPQHARQGRHRLAHRLAPRAALLGRRHRDGPRQPHLLPGVRVAARLPDGDHRARGRRWGRSTPRTTSPAACASRPASRRRTCRGTRACAR